MGNLRNANSLVSRTVLFAALSTAVIACGKSDADNTESWAAALTEGTLASGADYSANLDAPAGGTVLGPDFSASGTAFVDDSTPALDTAVVYVLDLSGSTMANANGNCFGDLNADGRSNTILDCQIAAIMTLNDELSSKDFIKEVSLVVFGATASSADVDPNSGSQTSTTPTADLNNNGVADLIEVVRSAIVNRVQKFTFKDVGNTTNYGAALSAAAGVLNSSVMPNKRVVFLSDGVPTTGPTVVQSLPQLPAGTIIDSFAVGSNANCGSPAASNTLAAAASLTGGTCYNVPDPSQLPGIVRDSLQRTVGAQLTLDGNPLSGVQVTTAPEGSGTRYSLSGDLSGIAPGAHRLCVTLHVDEDGVVQTLEDCQDIVVNSPPQVSCDAQVVQADESCHAQVSFGTNSDPDGDVLNCTSDAPADFGIGETTINYSCSDAYASASCAGTVTVEDVTPPTIEALAAIQVDCASAATVLTQPVVSDCSDVTLTAELVSGGQTTALSSLNLPAGTNSGFVRWTATDAFGNSTSVEQSIVVGGAALWANNQLQLRDRSSLLGADGNAGTAYSSGDGGVQVGVQALVGDIVSVGNVFLQDRANVQGDISTSASVQQQNQVFVGGSISQTTSLNLPALPQIPAVGAVPNTWTSIEPGQSLQLAPGAHGNVSVKTGSTLILEEGQQVFASLSLEPGAVVRLLGSSPFDIVVVGNFQARGTFEGATPKLILLSNGYITFETSFSGSVVAPEASLAFGAGQQLTFSGSYYAKNIEVRPDVTVRCGL